MARREPAFNLPPPYLRRLALDVAFAFDETAHPFTVPGWEQGLTIEFTRPVTIFAGLNGSGKSTILEAIAEMAGFGSNGGSRNYSSGTDWDSLNGWQAGWKPKISKGFFVKAEGFASLIERIDGYVGPNRDDGKLLDERSHGQAYFQVFRDRLVPGGLYILDEPEAALSPALQIEFVRIVMDLAREAQAQFIIATHAPMIMAIPGATLLLLTEEGPMERPFETTDHFRTMREFYKDPRGFMEAIAME